MTATPEAAVGSLFQACDGLQPGFIPFQQGVAESVDIGDTVTTVRIPLTTGEMHVVTLVNA